MSRMKSTNTEDVSKATNPRACSDPFEMLQISARTGLSGDYLNEFAGPVQLIYNGLRTGRNVTPELRERLLESPLRTYEERFPPSKYPNLYTPSNRQQIIDLNTLAHATNLEASLGIIDVEDIKGRLQEARKIISGSNDTVDGV